MKAVILAAGKSTRMKSEKTKMAHTILGREIIRYLLDSLYSCGLKAEDIVIVVGDNEAEIRNIVREGVGYARQQPQLGTAHALLAAAHHIRNFEGELIVTVGDNPYITTAELQRLIDHHHARQAACTFISAIFPESPPPYGRVLRDPAGKVTGVVEEIDATPEQKTIREVNSSIYLLDNKIAFPLLTQINDHNSKKEFYLTDIIGLLVAANNQVEASQALDYRISIGINNRWELQQAQAEMNRVNLQRLSLEQGVTILQPESVTIELDVTIGSDTTIFPNTYIAAGTRIGKNCHIGPFTFLQGVIIPDGQSVSFQKRTAP